MLAESTRTNKTASPWLARIAPALCKVLTNPWLESVVRLSAIEDSLRLLHPLLSLSEVRARVLEVRQETGDCKTFILQTNALWQGGTLAGQFVQVQLEINGRRVQRVYSLSCAPDARHLAITVKRQPGGRVSNYLHEHIVPGSVLTLSQANGEFVLPAGLPDKILLLSAGSGITPVMAMLRDLQARGYAGSLQFVHVCRDAASLIFAGELQAIAAQFPALRLHLHFTREHGAFSMTTLQHRVPDLASRATWLCGPQGLMDSVHALWLAEGWSSPLHSERFSALARQPAMHAGTAVAVRCSQSDKQLVSHGATPLLLELEQAGLQPKHGCRIGICRSCQCIKHSGTVENLQTGEICAEPGQLIRLCISAARSPLSLDI